VGSAEVRLSTFRAILQKIVLGVNRLPFGTKLTRIPYGLALWAVTRLVKKHPAAIAVFARNSYALGTWVPGRSDIDLTLVLAAGSSLDDELATARGFRNAYAALQRWFPMLGEIEFISAAHLDAWSRYSITGYEARFWLPVFGDIPARSLHEGESAQLLLDRLNHAISIYVHQMSPVVQSASRSVLRRYTQKIMKYLDAPAEEYADHFFDEMSRIELQVCVVQELCVRVGKLAPKIDNNPLNLESLFGRPLHAVVENATLPGYSPGLDNIDTETIGVLQSTNDPQIVYFVLEDEFKPGQLGSCIANAFEAGFGSPRVMPSELFLHYLRYVDPLECLGFLRKRTLLSGRDPLAAATLCSRAAFDRAMRDHSVFTLNFPYRSTLEQASDPEYRGLLLGWVALLARYFAEGVIEFDFDKILSYMERNISPIHVAEWLADPDNVALRFRLARSLVDTVATALESD
jgi:hypothetical protein